MSANRNPDGLVDVSWLADAGLPNDPAGAWETRGNGRNERRQVAVGRAAVGSQREERGFERAVTAAAHDVLSAQGTTRERPPVFGADPGSAEFVSAAQAHRDLVEENAQVAQHIINGVYRQSR